VPIAEIFEQGFLAKSTKQNYAFYVPFAQNGDDSGVEIHVLTPHPFYLRESASRRVKRLKNGPIARGFGCLNDHLGLLYSRETWKTPLLRAILNKPDRAGRHHTAQDEKSKERSQHM
jgi:hypothetical protein